MGAWGTAIFSDDLAADLRDDYRRLVGDGLSGPEATDQLLKEYESSVNDMDDGPVFWLVLAAIQWKVGRLEDRVREKALQIIDDGSDLRKWSGDDKLRRKRADVLNRLREQLNSAQPPARRLPRIYRNACDWAVGQLVSYRLLSGRLIVLRVIGHHTDKGGTAPVCELLDWVGDQIPSKEVLDRLPVKDSLKRYRPVSRFDPVGQLMIGAISSREFPRDRVNRLDSFSTPSARPGGFTVMLWRFLDRHLKDDFGLD
jgi:hypothetical protein